MFSVCHVDWAQRVVQKQRLWFLSKYSWKERITALLLLSFPLVYSNFTALGSSLFWEGFALTFFQILFKGRTLGLVLLQRLPLRTAQYQEMGNVKRRQAQFCEILGVPVCCGFCYVGQCPKNWTSCSLTAPVWTWACWNADQNLADCGELWQLFWGPLGKWRL